jgi:hypothetical protein
VSTDFWGRFPRDPRRAENAGLRAADRDREVIFEVLTQSYAEGRLNQLELEERTTAVTSAKTLGELPAIVADLVVPTPLPAAGLPAPTDLHAEAVRHYIRARREAVWSMISTSVLCVAIWLFLSGGDLSNPGFPWPLIVIAVTGLNVAKVIVRREDEIADRVKKLEKKHRKELERADWDARAHDDRD